MYICCSAKDWERPSPVQRHLQHNFCHHTTDGGKQHIEWLESTEMSTAEVTTQVRSTHWKDLLVFLCLVIFSNLNSGILYEVFVQILLNTVKDERLLDLILRLRPGRS